MNARGTDAAPVVLDRRRTATGELCLRRTGDHHEIISNGVFLMSSEHGTSERALVDEAVRRARRPRRALIAGLGVGFSLARACEHPQLERITLVELEPVIVEWHRRHFAARLGAPLGDPRVADVRADVGDWLATCSETFDLICLDVDNAPDWTVRPDNDHLYLDRGLERLAHALSPGGVLAVWSAHHHAGFARRLDDHFRLLEVLEIPAPRGRADVLYLARNPRAPTTVVVDTPVAGHRPRPRD